MEHNEAFHYTYSAQQREEIQRIRNDYLPKEENKMDVLRRLHNSVSAKAKAWSIGLGTLGALILGTGMSLVMTNLGQLLGLASLTAMILGIAIGIVGLALVGCGYPVYKHVLEKERRRVAPEILRLTEELMK